MGEFSILGPEGLFVARRLREKWCLKSLSLIKPDFRIFTILSCSVRVSSGVVMKRRWIVLLGLLGTVSAHAFDSCDRSFHEGPLPLSRLFQSGAAVLVLPEVLVAVLRRPMDYSALLQDFYHPINAALKDAIRRATKKDWPRLKIHDAHVVFGRTEAAPYPVRDRDAREWTVRVTIPFPYRDQSPGSAYPIEWMSGGVYRDLPSVAAPPGAALFNVLEMGDHAFNANASRDVVHFDFEVELWP